MLFILTLIGTGVSVAIIMLFVHKVDRTALVGGGDVVLKLPTPLQAFGEFREVSFVPKNPLRSLGDDACQCYEESALVKVSAFQP